MDTLNTREVDIDNVLLDNYMPYAKGTIIARAIPSIDGLKPSNRRILYTMYNMNLINGDLKKSSRIVGQTMTYHPHGDASIYDTLVRMTQSNESLNVPYVIGKGNFGKVWSKNTAPASARYTEAKLSPICNELFEGLYENAVDLVDNFDNTEKEPTVLPVKFPSILVNTSNGIAVGYSSSIAPFGLKEVCNATIGILKGEITDTHSLMAVIGSPEFSTGGNIHPESSELYKLMETGRGTFILSGKAEVYKDRIIIREIPYNATVEGIVEDIKQYMKTDLKEVLTAKDLSDIKGLSIQVMLKRGSNAEEVLKKLHRLTKLRSKITFNNTIIINGRCKTLGVYEILKEWIGFRLSCVERIYTFRQGRKQEQIHILETWEIIKDNIDRVVSLITAHNEQDTKQKLKDTYGLSDTQIDYLLDMKVRTLTSDRLNTKLKELDKARADYKRYSDIVADDTLKKQVIIRELEEIVSKYGRDRKCLVAQEISKNIDSIEDSRKAKEKKLDDSLVGIVVTTKGNVKKLLSPTDIENFESNNNDPIRFKLVTRNNEKLLVFTSKGYCYKVAVSDIDSSKGYPKDYILGSIDNLEDKDIIMVKSSDKIDDFFNIILSDGKGIKVSISRVLGNRTRYKGLYDTSSSEKVWVTEENEFFIITGNRKACYIDTTYQRSAKGVSSYKACKIDKNDYIFGIQPLSKVPDKDSIDISVYQRNYTVAIKHKLW